ncbi:MAG: hypothetical protein HYZ44_14640 [Bacteroidetes bacterium]|nr:hypothetical protein [Bacteroidota bacterium]
MSDIKIIVENFDRGVVPADFDLLCLEKGEDVNNIYYHSLVTVELTGNYKVKIRFDWKEDEKIKNSDFVYKQESSTLFFRSQNQWGAIDLRLKKLNRHERSHWTPTVTRKGDFVLIEDDLMAESTQLNGDKIHSVPIDPPTEATEYEDRIEYNSPIFGRQVLKTK